MRIPLPSFEAILLSVLLACLAGLASWLQYPTGVNHIIHDSFQRTSLSQTPDDIIIIGIDEASLQGIGKWPWRRDIHAQLINILTEADVAAIGFDVIFSERDTPNPQYDTALVQAVKRNQKVALPVYVGEHKQGGQLVEVYPFDDLADAARKLAHIHIEIDQDGVLRSTYLKEGLGNSYWEHLSLALYEIAYGKPLSPIPGTRSENPVSDGHAGKMIVRDYRNQVRFIASPGGFKTLSYIDVLDGRYPLRLLHNKVIFIGTMAAGLSDTLATPVSGENRHMQGVELNANIFHALRSGNLIAPMQTTSSTLTTMLLVLFSLLFLTTVMPSLSLIVTIILCCITLLLSFLALQMQNLWWPPAAAFITIALSYPLWSWRRLDRSMSYLREELQTLETETGLLNEQPPLNQLRSGLQLMVRWLLIDSWNLNRVENHHNNKDMQWRHQANKSIANILVDNEAIEITVNWKPDTKDSDDIKQKILSDLLSPWQGIETALPRGNTDAVAFHIAQIKHSQASRRQLRYFIFNTLAKLQDGVVATSVSGRVVLINEQARKLLRLDTDSVIDKTFVSILEESIEISHKGLLSNTLHNVYMLHEPTEIELSTKDGYEILLQGNEFELEDENSRVIVFTLTDITRLRKMERTRAETLNFVSHDLRSPLVSILALIERNSNETSHEEFFEIQRYAQRALSYTESFLQLARAETGNIFFYECDIHAIAANACEYLYTQAQNKHIKIVTEHCDDDVWVWGNGDLLERMIINLLDNAIKYSGKGRVVTLQISLEKGQHEWAKIKVIDQGIGIPMADQPHLFEQFRRGSSDESRSRKGAGLGLRFISVTVQRHKGKIEVKSEEGSGSEFSIQLPLLHVDIEE